MRRRQEKRAQHEAAEPRKMLPLHPCDIFIGVESDKGDLSPKSLQSTISNMREHAEQSEQQPYKLRIDTDQVCMCWHALQA